MNKKIFMLICSIGISSLINTLAHASITNYPLRWAISITNQTDSSITVGGNNDNPNCWYTSPADGNELWAKDQYIAPGQTKTFNTSEIIGIGPDLENDCVNDSVHSWMQFNLNGHIIVLNSDHGRYRLSTSRSTYDNFENGAVWWIERADNHTILTPNGRPNLYVDSNFYFPLNVVSPVYPTYISVTLNYNGEGLKDISYTSMAINSSPPPSDK